MKYTCRDCKYFNNDPAFLEKAFPGLNALSSAYGSTRGENGICSKRDLYLSPIKQCGDFSKLTTHPSQEITGQPDC
ncbi:MAG: hypothetical protein A2Z47_04585 [Thermodesulfovibrio sp. RBG_19FT_COMBO_42_12]|nr:MAG: hypothetical protein A2Z47_04585 [Thermodesulfovibrio sp. RBG_19FT_COMBO_42_12]